MRKEAFESKKKQLQEILIARKQLKDEICKNYFKERHRVLEEEKPDQALRERLMLA